MYINLRNYRSHENFNNAYVKSDFIPSHLLQPLDTKKHLENPYNIRMKDSGKIFNFIIQKLIY